MITLEQVLRLHKLSIDRFGGTEGIRDVGLLESAIARPYQTFDGRAFYPSPLEKAAAIAESLIMNHPFIDGNKRVGFLAMFVVLEQSGVRLIASEEEAYNFVISISTGSTSYIEIVAWLSKNT